MAFLMASLSCSLSVSRTPATTEHAGRKKKKVILERRRSSRCGGRHLTFEDNLQFVPQNIEDAVAGAGLWDDVPFQPPPTRVLVEIVTWLHRCVHVLQQSSRFEARCGGHKQGGGGEGAEVRSHMERKGSCRELMLYRRAAGKKHQQSQPLKHVHSPAVTQSAVVHTGSRLDWNSCPGKSIYLQQQNKNCQLKHLRPMERLQFILQSVLIHLKKA